MSMRRSDPGKRIQRRAEPDLVKRRRAAHEAGERVNRSSDAKEREALYKSQEWRLLRAVVLREEPSCRVCGAPSNVVDHVQHGPAWRERFFDRANLRGMCKTCHDRRSARDRHLQRSVRKTY